VVGEELAIGLDGGQRASVRGQLLEVGVEQGAGGLWWYEFGQGL
jgi:hypothetical protein